MLDEDDAQGGEAVEDAVEDQAHHLVGRQQRVGGHEVVVVAGESDRRGGQFLVVAAGQVAADGDVVFGGGGPHRVVHRVAPGRPALGLDQDLRHVRVPGPLLDLGGGQVRRLDGHADRAAPALDASCCGIEPVVGLPVVECAAHRVIGLGQPGRVGAGFQDRDVGAGLHDQLLERQVGVAAGEFDRRTGRCPPASHRSARNRVRRSRSGRRTGGCGSTCCATVRGCTAPVRRAARHRMHIGIDAPHRDTLGGRHSVGGGDRHRDLPLDFSLSILPCRRPICAQ